MNEESVIAEDLYRLKKHAADLERLIAEATRLRAEIHDELHRLRERSSKRSDMASQTPR